MNSARSKGGPEVGRVFNLCLATQFLCFCLLFAISAFEAIDENYQAFEASVEATAATFGYRTLGASTLITAVAPFLFVIWPALLIGLWRRKLWGLGLLATYLVLNLGIGMIEAATVGFGQGWAETADLIGILSLGGILALAVCHRKALGFTTKEERGQHQSSLFD